MQDAAVAVEIAADMAGQWKQTAVFDYDPHPLDYLRVKLLHDVHHLSCRFTNFRQKPRRRFTGTQAPHNIPKVWRHKLWVGFGLVV